MEVSANLRTDSNKNLARSHFFNIRFNTANVRITKTPHKILTTFFICWSSFISPQVKQSLEGKDVGIRIKKFPVQIALGAPPIF